MLCVLWAFAVPPGFAVVRLQTSALAPKTFADEFAAADLLA